MKEIVKIFTIVCLALIIIPLSVQAFSFDKLFDELDDFFSGTSSNTQITNEINVSANTGGNKSEGGEVKEGETKTEVEVKTVINGNEIEPIDIESDASSVSVTSEIKADDGVAQVEREVQIDSEKTTQKYEVLLENANANVGESAAEAKIRGVFVSIQNWWFDFTTDVRSLFSKILAIF